MPDEELAVYLIEDAGATISPWGRGNSKLGPTVFTYSKLPGRVGGSCPGSSPECEMVCYAKRVVTGSPPVWSLWTRNTLRGDAVPELPAGAEIVRFHVSGDFDTPQYVLNWCVLVGKHPDVKFFGYTRSWQVPAMQNVLGHLRDRPNVQLFASVDSTMDGLPPKGWRRAWLDTDPRATKHTIREPGPEGKNEGVYIAGSFGSSELDSSAYICPEESGRKPSCVACNYCITGQRGDVIFPIHEGEPDGEDSDTR